MDVQHAIAWGLFLAFVLAMIAADLLLLHRKPHEIRMREAALGALVPVSLAVVFLGAIYWAYSSHILSLGVLPGGVDPRSAHFYPTTGRDASLLFLTGYVVELSLSADNVFLFVLLMCFFRVPRALQHRVLFWGVIGALAMRGVMIIAGAALLTRFAWIIYIFGAFLIFTGVKMLFSKSEHGDPTNNLFIRTVRKILPIHMEFVGQKFFTKINGRTVGTTLLLVLICIEFTDLVFALDSIPAIFGITRDPFIVFTSNVFAILGLRSMYFLLAGIMDKFHYLKYGLALVLAFVGIKMTLPAIAAIVEHFTGQPHEWELNDYASLGIILATLIISIVASLLKPAKTHTPNPLQNPDVTPEAPSTGQHASPAPP